MKARIVLVGALMFFGLSVAAFAQANYDTGSTPVTNVVRSGHTERTGDISFIHTPTSGTSVAGTISISYPVPITVPFTGAASPTVTGTGGYLGTVSINVTASSNTTPGGGGGVLVINVPAGVTSAVGGTIRVSGVRIGVAGSALTTDIKAILSATGNTITTGQTNPTVITAVAAAITSVVTVPASGIRVSAVSGAVTSSPTLINIKEGFLTAFGQTTVTDTSQTTSPLVLIRLSAAPPAGVTITFPGTAGTIAADATTTTWQTVSCSTGAAVAAPSFTSASTTLTVCYGLTLDSSPTVQETMSVSVTATAPGTATLPLAPASITVWATFAPLGTAFTSAGAVITTPIPRYVSEEIGPANLLSVFGANTTLLIPFATTVTGANYNTGIAISNSTSDPGTTLMGVSTAIPQSGTITFHFYPALPSTAASFTYPTQAGSPGSGLNAAGLLPAGSTYTVLLSQLLAAAGQPADFSGYVFVITNFTNAHCLSVVSNFTSFSQGSLALVINQNRTGPPILITGPATATTNSMIGTTGEGSDH